MPAASVTCSGRLLVIGILVQLTGQVSAQTWSYEVSDLQYGRLGSNVTLTCDHSRTGAPVEWRVNGSSVLPRQVLLHSSSLTLPSADASTEGNYSCHGQGGALIRAVRLRLGHPPARVNITCTVPNYFRVLCSWTEPEEPTLPTHFISSYTSHDNGVKKEVECVQEEPGMPRCVVYDPHVWMRKHEVNITAVNPLGAQQTITTVDLIQQMRPDPPEDVTASEVQGHPTKLLVQWKIPESWRPDSVFPLVFQLRYQPVGSKYWTMLYTEESTSLMIMDALAGHAHHIQVQAREALNTDSQWSDWSQLVQAQPWREVELVTEPPADPDPITPEHPTPPVTSPVRRPDSPDGGGLGLVMLFGLFAGVVVVVGFTVILLLWIRQRRRGGLSKQQLTSMVKMKALLI